MSPTAKPRIRAARTIDYCRICRSDRQQPGMTLGPVTLAPAGEGVHVCGKCLLDMLKTLLKDPASSTSGRT